MQIKTTVSFEKKKKIVIMSEKKWRNCITHLSVET